MPNQPLSADLKQVRFSAREREFVYGVALKYLKNEEDAQDVTQEALILAHRHREKFRGDSRFTTWLYRIAATTALMHLRKQRRRPPPLPMASSADGEVTDLDPATAEPSAEERLTAAQQLARCDASLMEMGPRYREVFRLRFVEGYTEDEIAERLGLTAANVKTRAYRARARVRAALGWRGAA
ncbi:MAG TPA: sigma-70 family RNA polymerase sigma factor [Polyangia bacterium]|jgi:RNA polymerase sigma-70 factor (ECF subfamily)